MNVPRMGHFQAKLPDGSVGLFGGHTTGFYYLTNAEIWEPTSNTFTLYPMLNPHDFAAASFLLDGRLLLAGGGLHQGGQPGHPHMEIFDPAKRTFTYCGNLSRPRMTCAAATIPLGKEVSVFDNETLEDFQSGPFYATTFTISETKHVTYFSTFHWNDGQGKTPGTLALRHSDGTVYGPWQAEGAAGPGGSPANAHWVCRPYTQIKAGTYTVLDSDPPTWTHNVYSGYSGFARVSASPNLHGGKVLIVGGHYADAASQGTADIFDPVKGTCTLAGSLNYKRSYPVVLPTEDGRIVVCGGISDATPTRVNSVEVFDPVTSRFSVLQNQLISSEAGWIIGNLNRPVDDHRLLDGNYIFSISRTVGTQSEYGWVRYDPVAVKFEKVAFPSVPYGYYAGMPFVDKAGQWLIFGFRPVSGASPLYSSLGMYNLTTNQTFLSGNYVYYPSEYASTSGANYSLLSNGKLFVTGGTSATGDQINYSPVNRTIFLIIDRHDPRDIPRAEILLHARLTNGWLDPEATEEGVAYRYTWTSNGKNDPVIVRGPKAELEDVLHPGDEGATLDAGETWKVTITPVNGNGTEGPSIQGSFIIGPGLSVTFNGWVVQ